MTRLGWMTWISAGTLPLAILGAGAGCSSTSNGTTPSGDDAATEASSPPGVEAGVDAGTSGVSLTWGTYLFASQAVGDGGSSYSADGGSSPEAGAASDGGSTLEAGSTLDAGTPTPEAGPPSEGGPDGSADAGSAPVPTTNDAAAGVDANGDASGGDATVGDDGGQASTGGVPGVQVCAYMDSTIDAGAPPIASAALSCVTSAADGTFVFQSLPVRTNLALTFNKTGFVPVVLSIATASTPMDARTTPVYMFPAGTASTPVTPVPGVTLNDPTKGQIYIFAIGPSPDGGSNFAGEPGATVAMTPMSGNGPYYQADDGTYPPSATSFIQNGAAYFNVSPGTYTLTFADPTDDCEPILDPAGLWGFPVTTPAHSLQALVLPGYVSGLVGALCTKTSVLVAVDGG